MLSRSARHEPARPSPGPGEPHAGAEPYRVHARAPAIASRTGATVATGRSRTEGVSPVSAGASRHISQCGLGLSRRNGPRSLLLRGVAVELSRGVRSRASS